MKFRKAVLIPAIAVAVFLFMQTVFSLLGLFALTRVAARISDKAVMILLSSYDILLNSLYSVSMLASLFSNLVTAAVLCALPFIARETPEEGLSVRECKYSVIPLSILFGITASAAIGILWEMIPFPESMWDEYNALLGSTVVENNVITFLAVAVMAPITEELLFRALICGGFSSAMPKWLAVFLSALIFGIIHGNLIQGSYAFCFGLILGFFFIRTCSVIPGILIHVGFNSASYFFAPLDSLPEMLAGTVMLIIAAASVLLFFILLFVTRDKTNASRPLVA